MYGGRFLPVIRSVVSGRSELISTVKSYGNSLQTQHSLNVYPSQKNKHNAPVGLSPYIQDKFRSRSSVYNKPLNADFYSSTNNKQIGILNHNENDHAHKVLRSIPAYTCTTVALDDIEKLLSPTDTTLCPPPLPNINWSSVEPRCIAGSFVALSKECKLRPMNINSNDHQPLFSALHSSIPFLSDNMLKEVLGALSLWPQLQNYHGSNFFSLWTAIDNECVKRVAKWNIDHTLIMADLMYNMKLSRVGSYTRVMLYSLGKIIEEMKPHHIVQYLFHLNLSREAPSGVSFTHLERSIANIIEKLSLEEIGVISMGLFKSQSFIRIDELKEHIFDKYLKTDLTGVSSITIASIFKLMRKSVKANHVDKLYLILEHTVPVIKDLSHLAQLQVALVGSDSLVFHPKVINQIALNFASMAEDLRLKDIERIVLILMLYNFIPPEQTDIINIFVRELRNPERIDEINQYPKSFFSCIVYMVTLGYLPVDLISMALQPKMVETLLNSPDYGDIGREIMELDFSLDIELPPSYKGNRLHPELKRELVAQYFERARLPRDVSRMEKPMPPLTFHEKLTMEVESKIESLIGDGKCFTTFILPHASIPDIVFCTNLSGEPRDVPESFRRLSDCQIKHPKPSHSEDGEPLRWNVIVTGGRNSFIRGTCRIRGQMQMKIRQLETLGYRVTLVPYLEFTRRSVLRKLERLNDLLTTSGAISPDDERVGLAHAIIKSQTNPGQNSDENT